MRRVYCEILPAASAQSTPASVHTRCLDVSSTEPLYLADCLKENISPIPVVVDRADAVSDSSMF